MSEIGPSKETSSPEGTRKVMADLKRIRDRPPPSDPRSAGCVVAIVAVVALALLPFVGPGLSLSGTTKLVIGLGLAVIGLVGGFLGLFGGGFVTGAVATDVEEALEDLGAARSAGDEDAVRQAAIRILDGAYVSTGPTTVGTFDVREVAERLGDALPSVERIERILLQQNEIYPVFTTLERGARRDKP